MQGQNELDQDFINTMLLIEQNYGTMNKHQRIRIELWTKKLCQVTTNEVWKKNRNLYGKILLQQVLKSILTEPFDKRPPEGPLLKLNKYQISYNQSALKENKRVSYPKLDGMQLDQQNQNSSHNLFQQNLQNNENSKIYLNQNNSNRSRSRSPFEAEDQNAQLQINEQQKTISFQQAQIQQLSQFNEKLVRSIISCRQYLDRIQDPQSTNLKNEQDSLFQWMHEQSQMLFTLQQDEQNQQQDQANMLEQIDEQEEDQELISNDRNIQDSSSNLDLMMYLERFEQKGVILIHDINQQTNLKKASEQMLNSHFGATQQIHFNQ